MSYQRKFLSLERIHFRKIENQKRKLFSVSAASTLPVKFSLDNKITKILDQQQSSACTGFSFAQNLRLQNFSIREPSPLWIYDQERILEQGNNPTFLSDEGANPSDALTVLSTIGVVSEQDYPFQMNLITQVPPISLIPIAQQHKVRSVEAVSPSDHDSLKHLLNSGVPVSIGIMVYESFMTSDVAQTGTVPMPTFWEAAVGGHEVLLVGYDEPNEKYLFVNSWGNSFGCTGWNGWQDRGLFTLPFKYLRDGNLSYIGGVVFL